MIFQEKKVDGTLILPDEALSQPMQTSDNNEDKQSKGQHFEQGLINPGGKSIFLVVSKSLLDRLILTKVLLYIVSVFINKKPAMNM